MPNREHHRARVIATLGAAGAHAYLALIGFLGLLDYTVPTLYEVLAEIAAQDYWAWIHLGCAILLVASLRWPKQHVKWRGHTSVLPLAALACNVGFAMMFTWALFNFLWGLTVERPVSLAGPGLAFAVAFGEQLLATGWTRGTYNKGR